MILVQSKDAAGKPAMVENVQFWGAQKNDGLRVMPNETEAYRLGDKPFEFHKTNGFVTTLEASSKAAPGKEAYAK